MIMQRVYVDILEVNPPFSVWLHAAYVGLGRLAHVRAETAIDYLLLVLSGASLWLSSRILAPIAPERAPPHGRWLSLIVFAALTILPGSCYGEREHVALIFFMPVLAAAIRRADAVDSLPAGLWIAVGLCAGMVMCVKPHFALAIAGAVLAVACYRRSAAPVFAPENFLAGALFVAYIASAFALYPDYWSAMMPMLQLLYLPVRNPFLTMISGEMPQFLGLAALISFIVWRAQGAAFAQPRRIIACMGMLGFLGAVFVQGKGWPFLY